MLHTQKFLRQFTDKASALAALAIKTAISATCHPDDGRVILNYSQIDSPKDNKMVKECRGLVLDSDNNWELVARAFPRFFNWEECPSAVGLFKWENCIAQTKQDGSLALLYHYKNAWHFNTRGSFGSGLVNSSNITWRELFHLAVDQTFFIYELPKEYTYIFELCTPYNQVVKYYQTPEVFLLTIFKGEEELSISETKVIAEKYNLPLVQQHQFKNIDEVKTFIQTIADLDQTFEGIVLRDKKNLRFKIKSPRYLELHRLSGNGNIVLAKNLINIVMDNEEDEVCGYFPHVTPHVVEMKKKLANAYAQLEAVYAQAEKLESQKEFAEFVLTRTSLSGILFNVRKTQRPLKEVFNESRDILLKRLFS